MNIGAANFFQNFGGQRMDGFSPAGMPGMNMMAPMMGMGGGDRMMSSMMMMVMGQMIAMMGQMMAQNMGGCPMGMNPGNFGMPGMGCGCMNGGPMNGSPLGGFLGGGPSSVNGGPMGQNSNWGQAGGAQGQSGTSGVDSPSPMGPGGKVGNVDIGKLVQALPASRRKAAQKNFPYIVAEAQKQGVTNKAQLAYILATATHESGAGAHMEEFASGRAYEGRSTLGNTQAGDGMRYKGRGYVQLTGRRNYADWSRRLGMDLVGNPDRVKDPAIAAKILVGGMKDGTFTGKKLGSYINDQHTDFNGARKTVNGTDRAGLIGDIAKKLMAAMD